jgi:hypothetical protein
MLSNDSMSSMGGKARAEALTPEQRAEIARKAAETRWALPVAEYEGDINLGTANISCAVVEINKEMVRIISNAGLMAALKRPWKGSYKRTNRPNFLEAENLQPFITKELENVLELVEYRTPTGSVKRGYRAEMVPLLCEVYLRARETPDALHPSQLPVAKACEIIMRSLAKLGIVALVDEATGFQEIRDKAALAKILERYLANEARKWDRMFQIDYYRELFRLQGWNFNPTTNARTPYLGKLTNNIIYDRLQPGVLKKLDELNPRVARPDGKSRRKYTHHQFFTGDVGVPELKEHLSNVTILMKVSKDWNQFVDMLDKVKPRVGDTLKLPLE